MARFGKFWSRARTADKVASRFRIGQMEVVWTVSIGFNASNDASSLSIGRCQGSVAARLAPGPASVRLQTTILVLGSAPDSAACCFPQPVAPMPGGLPLDRNPAEATATGAPVQFSPRRSALSGETYMGR